MRMLRTAAIVFACLVATNVQAQGFGRGFAPRVYSGSSTYSGYGFSSGPYTTYRFNNGVNAYSVQAGHSAAFYRDNTGATGFGFGTNNFQYYRYTPPATNNGGFANFPKVGF